MNPDNGNEQEKEKTMTKYGAANYYKQFAGGEPINVRGAVAAAWLQLRRIRASGQMFEEQLVNRTYPPPLN